MSTMPDDKELDEIFDEHIKIAGFSSVHSTSGVSADKDTLKQALLTWRERYAEKAVSHALINIKDIAYPPSGKEYYFMDGSWDNSLSGTVFKLSELRKEKQSDE